MSIPLKWTCGNSTAISITLAIDDVNTYKKRIVSAERTRFLLQCIDREHVSDDRAPLREFLEQVPCSFHRGVDVASCAGIRVSARVPTR
jgi:hypothetical protein